MNYTDSLIKAYESELDEVMNTIEKNDRNLNAFKEILYYVEDPDKANRLHTFITLIGATLGFTLGSVLILTGIAGTSMTAALIIWSLLATLGGIFAHRKADSIVEITALVIDYEIDKLEDRNTVLYSIVDELESSIDRVQSASQRCYVINNNQKLAKDALRIGA